MVRVLWTALNRWKGRQGRERWCESCGLTINRLEGRQKGKMERVLWIDGKQVEGKAEKGKMVRVSWNGGKG